MNQSGSESAQQSDLQLPAFPATEILHRLFETSGKLADSQKQPPFHELGLHKLAHPVGARQEGAEERCDHQREDAVAEDAHALATIRML